MNDFLGKVKKGLDLYSMCFVYKSAVVFFCIERNRNKKKNVSSDQTNYEFRTFIINDNFFYNFSIILVTTQ